MFRCRQTNSMKISILCVHVRIGIVHYRRSSRWRVERATKKSAEEWRNGEKKKASCLCVEITHVTSECREKTKDRERAREIESERERDGGEESRVHIT